MVCLSGGKRKNALWCPSLPKRPRGTGFLGGPASSWLPLLHNPSTHTQGLWGGGILAQQALGEERGGESQGPPFLGQKPSGVKSGKAPASSRHPQLVLVCPHGLWREHWARGPSEGGHRHACWRAGSPWDMNGCSDRVHPPQQSHRGQWERESAASYPVQPH